MSAPYPVYFPVLTKEYVVEKASATGLDQVGISPPYVSEDTARNFHHWIDSSYHGEMSWLARHVAVRGDIRIRFPWARSIVVVAENYYHTYQWKNRRGMISRYAWGQDYHRILGRKISELWSAIHRDYPSVIGRKFVDTGPFLEKVLAVQAGLGWMGKNTCLISPAYGSYCFLGLLVLSTKLPFDRPIENRCGTCTRCIQACPTEALKRPCLLDARRCISYLTIEKKSGFSEREEDGLSDWLYGCDTCQEICPWNVRLTRETKERRYYSNLSRLDRNPEEWVNITAGEFREIFSTSAISRLKLDRLYRNVRALLRQ